MRRSLTAMALAVSILPLISCTQIMQLITADPETPTGLVASHGEYSDYVDLTWNAADNAETYIVQRSESQNGTFSILAQDVSGSPMRDTAAVTGTTYWYRVIAVNSADERSLPCTAVDGWAAYVTIKWEADNTGDYYQFYTNDPANCDTTFTTYWETYLATGKYFQGAVKKVSGDAGTPYGIIFWLDDTGYYYLYVNTEGQWGLSLLYNGQWTDEADGWNSSSYLTSGYDKVNYLTVYYYYESGYYYYYLYIGDDYQDPLGYLGPYSSPAAGYYGFAVGVGTSSTEDLPGTPVDARVKMVSPSSLPSVRPEAGRSLTPPPSGKAAAGASLRATFTRTDGGSSVRITP